MTTIDLKTALEMQEPFLKSADKKRLGITGYQLLHDWSISDETDLAYKISSWGETGSNFDKHTSDVYAWIPKSQAKIFQYKNEYDETCNHIFVKTWLYNKNKHIYETSRFKNFAY